MSLEKPIILRSTDHDNFYTDVRTLPPLLKHLPKKAVIWECAAGHGHLSKELKKEGYKVISTDINTGQDFLKYKPRQEFDLIVSNPPFSLKSEFLERAYEIGKPFAFLLPIYTLESSKKRQQLFRDKGLQLVFMDKRIAFELPSGEKVPGPVFGTAWFTYGLHIVDSLSFETIEGLFNASLFGFKAFEGINRFQQEAESRKQRLKSLSAI